MIIYVGNLSKEVISKDLRCAFERFGEVASVNIIREKTTDISRGFGFMEMPYEVNAQAAIKALNSKVLKGQIINVNQDRPHSEGRRDSKQFGLFKQVPRKGRPDDYSGE